MALAVFDGTHRERKIKDTNTFLTVTHRSRLMGKIQVFIFNKFFYVRMYFINELYLDDGY